MAPRIREDDNGPAALRQAQGPGYGDSRPSFPRRRESRDTSCKEWIPAYARMTKARGLVKKKIATVKHERTRSKRFFFRAFPCHSVANAFLCSSSVSVAKSLTLVELLDTALAYPFQHIEIPLGIQGQRMGCLEFTWMHPNIILDARAIAHLRHDFIFRIDYRYARTKLRHIKMPIVLVETAWCANPFDRSLVFHFKG